MIQSTGYQGCQPPNEILPIQQKKIIFFAEIVLRLAEFSQLEKYLAKQTRKISNLQDLEDQLLDIRDKSSPSTKLRFMQN